MDEKVRKSVPNVFITANVFSRTFLFFISPLLTLGKERPLKEDDLADPCPSDESKRLTEKLELEWAKELKKKRPSLLKALIRLFWVKIACVTLLSAAEEAMRMLLPLLISNMLKYFDGSRDIYYALRFAVYISLGVSFNCVIHHPFFLNVSRLSVKFRVALSGLVYKKAFRLNMVGMDAGSSGQLINLISTDCARVEYSILFLPYIFVAPVQLVFVVAILIQTVDTTILSGLLVVAIALPVQSLLGKIFDHMRRITSKKCDKRINLINEVLNGIKIIKMYCWENSFKRLVEKLRNQELKYQRNLFLVSTFNQIIDQTLNSAIIFVSVTVFIFFTRLPLLPSYIVIAMSYYMVVSHTIGFFFASEITMLIAANVSLSRIQDFLLKRDAEKRNMLIECKKPSIRARNLNARWTRDEKHEFNLQNITFEASENELVAVIGPVGSGKTSLLLTILEELQLTGGELDVKGSVFYVPQEPWIFTASIRQNILFGKPFDEAKFRRVVKSCCLDQEAEHTIVGEKGINLSGGQRARVNLARALYSDAQIYLFDDPLSAVDASVAKKIYENCINGYLANKIRILVTHQVHFLANTASRILYMDEGQIKFNGSFADLAENREINLESLHTNAAEFDSDEACGSKIEEKHEEEQEDDENGVEMTSSSFSPSSRLALIRKKSRSLSRSHSISSNSGNPAFTFTDSSHAEQRIIFSSNSNLVETKNLTASSQYVDIDMNGSSSALNSPERAQSSRKQQADQFEEKRTFGAMNWKNYFVYFKVGGGVLGSIFVFLIFIASQAAVVLGDYWLSNWASAEGKFHTNKLQRLQLAQNRSLRGLFASFFSNTTISESDAEPDFFEQRHDYYFKYCMIMVAILVLGSIRSSFFFTLCIRASRNLHKQMFDKVLCTPIRFFDTNPIGRIINRFSKDIGIIDETIPMTVLNFMSVVAICLGAVTLSCILNVYIILPILPLIVLFIWVRNYFLISSTEIKRIEGINRSPIFVHVNNTLSGLTTIRASNMEDKINEEYYVHTDYHTRAVTAFLFVTRWFGIRLDWIAAIFTYVTLFSSILLKDFLNVNPGQIGIMVVYIVNLVGLFQWTVRQSCEVENLMTAVERVLEYTVLPSEPLETGSKKPEPSWPRTGEIAFDNVSYSYDKDLPAVLKDLTFHITSGEKIGVVGRTGAGKSSIVQTLFRMAEPNGTILIDNVNIKDLSLHDLRSKISIIPQEPTLFIGTIRSNLDPFSVYSDELLWSALERVQLKQAVSEMSEGLDSEVQKGGSNLSVGQKQLICLARAIIKKSKILVIDEATANVDFKTDSLVQEAIRECFKDCTVLTIAHRLHTIIDSDRIICMNRGRIESFGRPYELLMDSKTILHGLVYSLDMKEREKLIDIAKDVYENNASPNVDFMVESLAKKINFSLDKSDEDLSVKKNEDMASDPNETDSLLSSSSDKN